MILTVIAVLLLLWLLGLIAHIGGGLIHLILLVALVVWLFDHLTDRNRPV